MACTRRFELRWLMAVLLVAMLLLAATACAPSAPEQPVTQETPFESGFAEVNGTRLYYEIKGTGEPLVLLHGLFADTRVWNYNTDEFARHYRTIRYDMRGYGQSGAPEPPYRHEEDLKALLDHLGISRAHIMGHSYGGIQGLNFAVDYPYMVLSFISVAGGIEGAIGLPLQSPEEAEVQADMAAALQKGDLDGAAQVGLGSGLFTVLREDAELSALIVRILSDYFKQHGGETDTVQLAKRPAARRLGEVATPSLFIVGELSIDLDHALADMFVEGVAQSRKVVMAGCDHMPLMEKPEEFNQIVLDFLAEHSNTAP